MSVPAKRLWFKYWPEGVPRSLKYPEILLFEFLSQAAHKWHGKTAFCDQERKLTYDQLDTLSSKLANGLRALGVKTRDRVVILLPNSLEFVIAYYGILKAGGTVTPANPLYRQAELKHHLHDSEATAIITSRDFYPLLKEAQTDNKLKCIILTDAEIEESLSLSKILDNSSNTLIKPDLNPREDTALIVYTGGTTGLPKGVLLTHYNLVANAMQNAVWFGWNDKDVIMGILPFYHSWGACTSLVSAIYSGSRVVIQPRFDAEEVMATVQKEKATVMYGAASMFTALVNSPALGKYDLSSLRYIKAGAMPIPPEIKERWEKLTGVKMVLGYGLSEASPETHNSPLQRVKPGPIGIPVIDTDCRIVDEATGNTEIPPGRIGELVVRGPQVMKGYLNRPEDTREALRDGWLYTGDLALMDEDGYFRILDRKKETIKYKGYTIAPAEVEAVLYEHEGIKECAVVGKPDAVAGEVPKAYIVPKQGVTLDKEELIKFCAKRIAPYKRIRDVEFTDEIPKTPVGKILRRLLRDRERKGT